MHIQNTRKKIKTMNKNRYVICQVCDKKFKSLVRHLSCIHNISTEEYKKRFPGTKLTSDYIKKKISNARKKSWIENPNQGPKGKKRSKESIKKTSDKRRGQKLTEKQKENMRGKKRTQEQNMANRERAIKFQIELYNWDLVEPYLHKKIKNGSRHRKYKFITLYEFKNFILQEYCIKDLVKMGYSNHQLGFFCRLAKGKFKLSKEILEEEIKTNSLDYIAKKYNIFRADLAILRQLYDINVSSGKKYQRLKNEIPLTQRQKEIMYGSMLGDASGRDSSIITFSQGICQKDYLFWKYEQFKDLLLKTKTKKNKYPKIGKRGTSWDFRLPASSDVELCNSIFYKNGPKDVYEEILDYLSNLSVAVWYMDDGCTGWGYRHKQKYPDSMVKPKMCFCTDSFSECGCELLVNFLKNKFDINSRLVKVKALKSGIRPYNIYIDNNSVYNFIDLISPYVIPSMRYKIDYKEYLKWRKEKETYRF